MDRVMEDWSLAEKSSTVCQGRVRLRCFQMLLHGRVPTIDMSLEVIVLEWKTMAAQYNKMVALTSTASVAETPYNAKVAAIIWGMSAYALNVSR